MNAKEYLSQATKLDQVISCKLRQREELEALAKRTTLDITMERVSGGKLTKSPMEDATVRLIDLCNEIDEIIDEYIDLKIEILESINKVKRPADRLLLEMRYLEGRSWQEIAYYLDYSERTVYKIHTRALKEIDKIRKDAVKGS